MKKLTNNVYNSKKSTKQWNRRRGPLTKWWGGFAPPQLRVASSYPVKGDATGLSQTPSSEGGWFALLHKSTKGDYCAREKVSPSPYDSFNFYLKNYNKPLVTTIVFSNTL